MRATYMANPDHSNNARYLTCYTSIKFIKMGTGFLLVHLCRL